MPRSRSIPAGTYSAGTYGPFPVDSFTNANTEALEVVLPTAGWPTDPAGTPLLRVTRGFDGLPPTSTVFSSGTRDKTGALADFVRQRFSVPRIGDTKRPVSGASLTIEVLVSSLSLADGGTFGAI